jgi:2-polyprenyl-6-methoxyphenol hydroxylase-like FAD-dependent oxidoreductase
MSLLRNEEPTAAFSDDVIGQHPDRQVLVVGDTIVGHTLVLLLDRAGFDPLLATGSGQSAESKIVSLWPSAVRALEVVGVNPFALEYTSINSVSIQSVIPSTENTTVTSRFDQPDGDSLVVVSTVELHHTLEKSSAERSRTIDRRIETLSYRDDGMVVQFADGIREWFDAVIYADSFDMADQARKQSTKDSTKLTQYEVYSDLDILSGEETQWVEHWSQDTYLQSVPRQTAKRLLRVTAPRETTAAQIARNLGTQLVSGEVASLKTKLSEGEQSTVQQTALNVQRIDSNWWGDGRICRCGQAAYATAPASGFRISAGIEDALAFVTELARGDRSTSDVVNAYADNRAQHFTALARTVRQTRPTDDYHDLIPSEPPLETMGVLRKVYL